MKRKSMLYKNIILEHKTKNELKKIDTTTSIGIVGVSKNVGVTHTIIMLAQYLSQQFKVAVLELNYTGAFKEICRATSDEECLNKTKFNYKKVDYYWDINLSNFIVNDKDQYDFVLLDLGNYENLKDFDEFIRTDRKLVIAHGVDWKIREIIEFYKRTADVDIRRSWRYCIPFIGEKYLKDVKSVINNPIYHLPFSMNPFKPNNEVKAFFDKYVL
ncbi:hypothetical protein PV797_04420 [Clostridiaceae bacterium M8S5]|nr:hypothetical protein PV797_04420 [Clostridiaceae bacterium M8S5]